MCGRRLLVTGNRKFNLMGRLDYVARLLNEVFLSVCGALCFVGEVSFNGVVVFMGKRNFNLGLVS